MIQRTERNQGVLRSIDWVTIVIYMALLVFGWLSVCGASYSFGDNDIFSMGTRSGMQIVWIGTSLCLGFVIMMLDTKFLDTFSYFIFGILLLLLFATIFNPHDIKGSHSWLVIGPLRLQPAEFGKFATALALAKLQHTQLETFCCCLRHNLAAHALHCGSARDGFGPCLSGVLVNALS